MSELGPAQPQLVYHNFFTNFYKSILHILCYWLPVIHHNICYQSSLSESISIFSSLFQMLCIVYDNNLITVSLMSSFFLIFQCDVRTATGVYSCLSVDMQFKRQVKEVPSTGGQKVRQDSIDDRIQKLILFLESKLFLFFSSQA